MSDNKTCWYCDSTEIVYTDVLDMGWCSKHYTEIYLEREKR